MKTTVQDVAKKAGVSTATVDRVLNGRKGVKLLTITKVQEAVRKLGYQPNRLASRLGKAKDYEICFLLPKGNNSFMTNIKKAIDSLDRHYRTEKIHLSYIDIDFGNEMVEQSILNATEHSNAVAIVAMDTIIVSNAIQKLSKTKPVLTLVSDAPNSNRIDYIGIDNKAAGRTAAGLLGRFMPKEAGDIILIMGTSDLRDHMDRREGFEQIIRQDFPYLNILPPLFCYDNYQRVEQYLTQFIENQNSKKLSTQIKGIYSLGGGNRGLVSALEKTRIQPHVVAHELTNTSIKALQSGLFDAVLAQNPLEEVKQSVSLLVQTLERPLYPTPKQQITIDIYMKDNLII